MKKTKSLSSSAAVNSSGGSDELRDGVVLKVENAIHSYGGVRALKGVDFSLKSGEIHGICGENGSGKSTLLKIISAQIIADSVKIQYRGDQVNFRSPSDSLEAGIGTVTQERSLVQDFTVAENIFLSRNKYKKWWGIDWPETNDRARQIMQSIGSTVGVELKVGNLSPGDAQMVEIARALVGNTQVLILDEPTSSLTSIEAKALFQSLNNLKKQGVGIIIISHRLEEIFGICDRITVLRNGNLISTGSVNEYTEQKLISEMIGRTETILAQPKKELKKQQTVLKIENLSVLGKFKNITLSVDSGEIVGIIGLVGAGQSAILESLFGLQKVTKGTFSLLNKQVNIRNPRMAMRHKIAFVPNDRKIFGLVLGMSVLENAIMASTSSFKRLRYPNPKKSRKFVETCIEDFGIVAASVDIEVSSLSGGNQQKVLLTKWLGTNPSVLLLDEPTRGVDVGAKAEIYRILFEQKAKGIAILVSSSEIPELLTLCDRILVMYRGELLADLNKGEATESIIASYVMGKSYRGEM